MHKMLHGAVIGLAFGALTPLLSWTILMSVVSEEGQWKWGGAIAVAIAYTAIGAVLGALLPKHK